MVKTADEFLTGLKARVTLPENQALLNNDALLRFADSVTLAHMVPKIISVNEDFFTVIMDIPCVVDQQLYEIPDAAIASSLGDVKYRYSTTNVIDLPYIEPEDEHAYRSSTGAPGGFNLRGDLLYLVTKPQNASHTIEMWVDRRPSKMVELSKCATITSVATDVVTVPSVPTGWTSGTVVDFIRNKGMGRVIAESKTISSVTTTTITFATDDVPATAPNEAKATDYIAPTGKSPIFQIPEELVVLLETWTSKRCMGAIGDFEAKKDLTYDEKSELSDALMIISPRVRGETRKITTKGLLRRGSTRRGGYYS